jgi:hypothetical protein
MQTSVQEIPKTVRAVPDFALLEEWRRFESCFVLLKKVGVRVKDVSDTYISDR